MEKFNDLKQLIISLEEDVMKFYERHNKAAALRVRNGLQDVKRLAQEVRVDIASKNKTEKKS